MKIFPLNGKLPNNNRVWEDKGMTHVGHQRVLEDKDVSNWLSTLETLTSEEEDKLVYQGWKCLQVKEREMLDLLYIRGENVCLWEKCCLCSWCRGLLVDMISRF